MINLVQFLKETWSGIMTALLGLFILIFVHHISKIDFVVGIWCIIQGLFLLIKWWQNRKSMNLVLGILDLMFAVPLVLRWYNSKIPMVYLIISVLILNAVDTLNRLYITSRNHLLLLALLIVMIVTVIVLILYPWVKQALWIPILSVFMLAYGFSYILFGIISLKKM